MTAEPLLVPDPCFFSKRRQGILLTPRGLFLRIGIRSFYETPTLFLKGEYVMTDPVGFYDIGRSSLPGDIPRGDPRFTIVQERTHPVSIDYNSLSQQSPTLEELGRALVTLRYDKLLEVLRGMQSQLGREKNANLLGERLQLAKLLDKAEGQTSEMIATVERIVKLCEPYQKK